MKHLLMPIPLCLVLCCGGQPADTSKESLDEVLKATKLVAYIEEHSLGGGTGSGHFGDVVLLDPSTKKKFYVTNDSFLDEHPVVSPDGGQIIFASSREGNRTALQLMGLIAPRFLYSFDTRTKRLRQFGVDEQGSLYNLYPFSSLVWKPDAGGLLYSQGDSLVLELTADETEEKVLFRFENVATVDNLSPSPDGKLLAVRTNERSHSLMSRLLVVHFETGAVVALDSAKTWPSIEGWLDEGRVLLIRTPQDGEDRFFARDCVTGETRPVTIPDLGDGFSVSNILVLSQEEWILVAYKEIEEPVDSIYYFMELVLYDVVRQQLTWLTDDRHVKDNVSVWTMKK